ncbi:hypothetical protein D3C85_1832510 [compost metagenome]
MSRKVPMASVHVAGPAASVVAATVASVNVMPMAMWSKARKKAVKSLPPTWLPAWP